MTVSMAGVCQEINREVDWKRKEGKKTVLKTCLKRTDIETSFQQKQHNPKRASIPQVATAICG